MKCFQKKCISLQCAFAWQLHIHCWKEKTLVVYWLSETAKTHSPEDRQPVSVLKARTTVAVEARRLAVPRYYGDEAVIYLIRKEIIILN